MKVLLFFFFITLKSESCNNDHYDNVNDEGVPWGYITLPYAKNDHGECAAGMTLTLYL